jgi:hypothetical protein
MLHRAAFMVIGGAALTACALSSSTVRADILPTPPHAGFAVHLDPFIGGAVALGAVGLPACGTPGEIVPAFTLGTPWNSTTCPTPGVDLVASPDPWHWEIELDILGLVGLVPTSILGAPFVPVAYGPGSDIYIDIIQSDLADSFVAPGVILGFGGGFCFPGAAEVSTVGDVCKQLLNLTPLAVAWGTSVTEGPVDINHGGFVNGPANVLAVRQIIDATGALQIVITKENPVPAPASLALLAVALLLASGSQRRGNSGTVH